MGVASASKARCRFSPVQSRHRRLHGAEIMPGGGRIKTRIKPVVESDPNGAGGSGLDAKSLESLVEAGELTAAVNQALLPAGPGRMRFRIDVEAQGVAGFAVR